MFSSFFFGAEGLPERSLSTKVQPSLKRLYHSRVCAVLMTSFPNGYFNINNQISHKHVVHENHPFLIAKKFTKQVRRTFTLIDTAQWLSN